MKGDVTLKILESIKDGIMRMSDLAIVLPSLPYGSSFGRFEYELSKLQREHSRRQQKNEIEKQNRQRFYNMIYKLERDNLIEKISKEDGIFVRLTKNGKECLESLIKKKKDELPKSFYKITENNNFTIVIFDIPELERRKRGWLRSRLKNLGFKLIQKSVWIGKVKIPKEFLDDLKELKLVNFVEIFEINKLGTLEQVI